MYRYDWRWSVHYIWSKYWKIGSSIEGRRCSIQRYLWREHEVFDDFSEESKTLQATSYSTIPSTVLILLIRMLALRCGRHTYYPTTVTTEDYHNNRRIKTNGSMLTVFPKSESMVQENYCYYQYKETNIMATQIDRCWKRELQRQKTAVSFSFENEVQLFCFVLFYLIYRHEMTTKINMCATSEPQDPRKATSETREL